MIFYMVDNLDWLEVEEKWAGLKAVGMAESETKQEDTIIRFPESSCVIGLATGPVAASFSLRRLKPATTNGFTGMRIT